MQINASLGPPSYLRHWDGLAEKAQLAALDNVDAFAGHDHLTKIARRLYGDGRKWRAIYYRNQQIIGNDPDKIFPDQSFLIPRVLKYKIKRSDTLQSISDISKIFFGTEGKADLIYRFNREIIGIDPAKLPKDGAFLFVPKDESVQAPSPSLDSPPLEKCTILKASRLFHWPSPNPSQASLALFGKLSVKELACDDRAGAVQFQWGRIDAQPGAELLPGVAISLNDKDAPGIAGIQFDIHNPAGEPTQLKFKSLYLQALLTCNWGTLLEPYPNRQTYPATAVFAASAGHLVAEYQAQIVAPQTVHRNKKNCA